MQLVGILAKALNCVHCLILFSSSRGEAEIGLSKEPLIKTHNKETIAVEKCIIVHLHIKHLYVFTHCFIGNNYQIRAMISLPIKNVDRFWE